MKLRHDIAPDQVCEQIEGDQQRRKAGDAEHHLGAARRHQGEIVPRPPFAQTRRKHRHADPGRGGQQW